MGTADRFADVEPESRAAWRASLVRHHRQQGSVWLVLPKKGSGLSGVAMEDAVEEALCFGWIDSVPRKLDERRSRLLVSPRKPTSNWSAINKARAEKMIAAGLMQPAGLAAIKAAKENGAWTALDAVERLEEPADLKKALDAIPAARRHWDDFPRSARRGILEWIGAARTEQTRTLRVTGTADKAARGERANQWRRTGKG
jgi:uncharacterized protein YdeI (YjbR/CyaY-like superfamily)